MQPCNRDQIDAIAVELGSPGGSLVVFAAETGLRTNEWAALERRDLDLAGKAVTVQRRFSRGVLTPYPKTEGWRRRVPLTARAVEAVRALTARIDTPLLFPASEGGRIHLDTWRNREWYPALGAAGITKRKPYCLRHTFATGALASGVSVFELARLLGSSVREIDQTYGHFAHDSEETIRTLLEARAARSGVDVASDERRE